VPSRGPGGGIQRRRYRDDTNHSLRVRRREKQRPPEAPAERREHRPLGAGRVEHGCSVAREDRVGVGRRVPGPVGPAVAARLEGDHTVVPGQERHLHLPVPGVQDCPRGQQQDRRLARAVHLVMDPHAELTTHPDSSGSRARISCTSKRAASQQRKAQRIVRERSRRHGAAPWCPFEPHAVQLIHLAAGNGYRGKPLGIHTARLRPDLGAQPAWAPACARTLIALERTGDA
jgi:hypothetical protein